MEEVQVSSEIPVMKIETEVKAEDVKVREKRLSSLLTRDLT